MDKRKVGVGVVVAALALGAVSYLKCPWVNGKVHSAVDHVKALNPLK
jgi:hypothetical protein